MFEDDMGRCTGRCCEAFALPVEWNKISAATTVDGGTIRDMLWAVQRSE